MLHGRPSCPRTPLRELVEIIVERRGAMGSGMGSEDPSSCGSADGDALFLRHREKLIRSSLCSVFARSCHGTARLLP